MLGGLELPMGWIPSPQPPSPPVFAQTLLFFVHLDCSSLQGPSLRQEPESRTIYASLQPTRKVRLSRAHHQGAGFILLRLMDALLCSTVSISQEEEAGPSFDFHCLCRGNGHRTWEGEP